MKIDKEFLKEYLGTFFKILLQLLISITVVICIVYFVLTKNILGVSITFGILILVFIGWLAYEITKIGR